MKNQNLTFIYSGLFLFLFLTFFSCKKDETCHGKVTVIDSTGAGVGTANVLLDASSVNGQTKYNGVTDKFGIVHFDIKLPAIFDVTATKSTYPAGSYGKGVLNVDEPGKEAEVIVTIH